MSLEQNKSKNLKLYFVIAGVTVLLMALSPLLNKGIEAKSANIPAKVNPTKAIDETFQKDITDMQKIKTDASNTNLAKLNEKFVQRKNVETVEQSISRFKKYQGHETNTTKKLTTEAKGFDPRAGEKIDNASNKQESYTWRDMWNDVGVYCVGLDIPLPANVAEYGAAIQKNKSLSNYVFPGGILPDIVKDISKDRKSKETKNKSGAVDGSSEKKEYTNTESKDAGVSEENMTNSVISETNNENSSDVVVDENGNKSFKSAEAAARAIKEKAEKEYKENAIKTEQLINKAKEDPELRNGLYNGAEEEADTKLTVQDEPVIEKDKTITNDDITPEFGYITSSYAQRRMGAKEYTIKPYSIEHKFLYKSRAFPPPINYAVYRTKEGSQRGKTAKNKNTRLGGHAAQGEPLAKEAKSFGEYWKKLRAFEKKYINQKIPEYQKVIVNKKLYHKNILVTAEKEFEKTKDPNLATKVLKNPKIKYIPRLLPGTNTTMDVAQTINFDSKSQKWIIGPFKLDYVDGRHKGADKSKDKIFATLTDVRLKGKYETGKGGRLQKAEQITKDLTDLTKIENAKTDVYDKSDLNVTVSSNVTGQVGDNGKAFELNKTATVSKDLANKYPIGTLLIFPELPGIALEVVKYTDGNKQIDLHLDSTLSGLYESTYKRNDKPNRSVIYATPNDKAYAQLKETADNNNNKVNEIYEKEEKAKEEIPEEGGLSTENKVGQPGHYNNKENKDNKENNKDNNNKDKNSEEMSPEDKADQKAGLSDIKKWNIVPVKENAKDVKNPSTKVNDAKEIATDKENNKENTTGKDSKTAKTNKEDKEDIPKPMQDFYITIDYDPTLESINKARFEFTYMIYAAEGKFYSGSHTELADITSTKTNKYQIVEKDIKVNYGKKTEINDKGEEVEKDDIRNEKGYYVSPKYEEKTTVEGALKNATSQPLVDAQAARWFEKIAIEVNFKVGLDLKLPIGGKVWEDKTDLDKKHIGYDHIFKKDGKDIPLEGIRVYVNRAFVRYESDKENSTITHILKKYETRLYDPKTKKELTGKDKEIFTNKNGEWGPYDIHDVGFSVSEYEFVKKNPKEHFGITFEVVYEYDGMKYEPVAPLQKDGNMVDAPAKTGEKAKENNNQNNEQQIPQKSEKDKKKIDASTVEPNAPIKVKKIDTDLFQNKEAKYNKAETKIKKQYENSSFVLENIKERERFNNANAEIVGEKPEEGLKTTGYTVGIDKNGNRLKKTNDLYYQEKKNQTTQSQSKDGAVKRFESEYITKVPKTDKGGQNNNQNNNQNNEQNKNNTNNNTNTQVPKKDEGYYNRFIEASTFNVGIQLPGTEKFRVSESDLTIKNAEKISGKYYAVKDYMKHINMGLIHRKVDLGLQKDLNNALVTVNKKAYSYAMNALYNDYLTAEEKRQGNTIDLNKIQKEADSKQVQKYLDIYKTDYIYRTAMYSSNKPLLDKMNEEVKTELSKDPMKNDVNDDSRQLDVFLTYSVQLYNDSPVDTAYISQLNDFHNDKLELVSQDIKKYIEKDPVTQKTKKDVLNDEVPAFGAVPNVEKGKTEQAKPKDSVKSLIREEVNIPKSKYIKYKKQAEIQNRNITALKNEQLKDFQWVKEGDRIAKFDKFVSTQSGDNKDALLLNPGERAEIFTTYRVKNAKDISTVKEKDALGALKDNGNVSQLSNALELGDFTNVAEIGAFATYNVLDGKVSAKLDQDSAPGNVNLKSQGGKLTNVNMEDDTDDAQGIRIQIPSEEIAKEQVRKLNGVVWEDIRNKRNAGILTGDGKLGAGEKGIENQPLVLEERISVHNNNKNGEFKDAIFVWPERISGKGITINNLKELTGFESVIQTGKDGKYQFTGVPAGNFAVVMNYSSANVAKLKGLYNTGVQASSIEEANTKYENINAESDITKSDLVNTIESQDRKVKYYNGMDFKNTMFYNGDQNKLNLTWIEKERTEKDVISFARDDEARRQKITKDYKTIINANGESLNEFRKTENGFVDDNKLKEAHKGTSIRTSTPKLNFSVEYYEKLAKKDSNKKAELLWFLSDIYVENIYNSEKANSAVKSGVLGYEVNNIGLGLVERPENKVVLNKEISNITLKAADGTELVNANYTTKQKIEGDKNAVAKGYKDSDLPDYKVSFVRELDKNTSKGTENILSLDRDNLLDGEIKIADKQKIKPQYQKTLKGGFRYINIDKELMQNATLSVRYQILALNLGEIDRKIDTDNIYDSKTAYYKGLVNNATTYAQSDDKYSYGKAVGPEYYVNTNKSQLDTAELSKTKIKSVADFADTGTEVKLDDKDNEEWQAVDKPDLAGLISGVKNENDAKNAKYIDSNGEEYIKTLENNGNKNLSSHIFVLKQGQLELTPAKALQDGKDIADNKSKDIKTTWKIRLDRTISDGTDSSQLTFENLTEILGYETGNGRRDISTPGNLLSELDRVNGNGNGEIPGNGKEIREKNVGFKRRDANFYNNIENQERNYIATAIEADSATTEIVTLSPPTGLGAKAKEMQKLIIGLSIAAIVMATTAIAIFIIKKQKQKEVQI